MNSNGPIKVSIIASLNQYHEFVYELFESYCDHLCWPYIFRFPTISKLPSVILTPRSLLVFLIFRPFPGRLVCFGQYGYTGCSPRAGFKLEGEQVRSTQPHVRAAKQSQFALLFAARAHGSKVSLLAHTKLDGGDSDFPSDINCVAIHYEKNVRTGMPSFGKRRSESRFQGK